MEDPAREFPRVRVLGTIGWIVAGLVVGRLGLESTAMPLKIAAGSSFFLGFFCLLLPHTPPKHHGSRITVGAVLGLEALRLMKDWSFTVFVLGSFLVCIPLQFYYSFTNLFLNESGVAEPASKMTSGTNVGDFLFAGHAVSLQPAGCKENDSHWNRVLGGTLSIVFFWEQYLFDLDVLSRDSPAWGLL